MSTVRILGLFNDFDAASAAILEVREADILGLNFDDVTIKSPIEHPDVEAVLGDRPVPVQKYTLIGSILGGTLSFFLISSAQGNFFQQLKGGKPIIPLPPNFVLTYEMLILGGVYITVLGFLIAAGLPARVKSSIYTSMISEDQIGVLVKGSAHSIEEVKKIFQKHSVLDIQEEVVA